MKQSDESLTVDIIEDFDTIEHTHARCGDEKTLAFETVTEFNPSAGFKARCVSKVAKQAHSIFPLASSYLVTLCDQLADFNGISKVYATTAGTTGNKVVTGDSFDCFTPVTNKITLLRHTREQADAMWLEPGEAFVDEVKGGIHYMAYAGSKMLVGRYTRYSADLIKKAFEGIPRAQVSVSCLFSIPRKRETSRDIFKHTCEDLKFGEFLEFCTLPPNAGFPHGGHSNPELVQAPALGICARLF